MPRCADVRIVGMNHACGIDLVWRADRLRPGMNAPGWGCAPSMGLRLQPPGLKAPLHGAHATSKGIHARRRGPYLTGITCERHQLDRNFYRVPPSTEVVFELITAAV